MNNRSRFVEVRVEPFAAPLSRLVHLEEPRLTLRLLASRMADPSDPSRSFNNIAYGLI